MVLLMAALPARAASYTFPDALPAGCSADLSKINTYNCGILTLAAGDTVTIVSATGPTTLNFSGAFTTGAGTSINLGGNVAELTLVLAGVLTLGDTSSLIASVITSAAVNLGTGSVVGGTITTNTPTGVVTTGDSSKVGGAISAQEGAVTIGANSSVLDSITANVGVVTIGNSSQINGDITAGVGAINIGASSTILGDINASVGAVNIGVNSVVHGNINASVGVVTIGGGSLIDGNILGAAGAVNTGANVNVGGLLFPGNIITTDGVITIGPDNTIGGNISSGVGAVTVGDGSKVGGNVSSDAGVVTASSSAVVCGIVSAVGTIISIGSESPACPAPSVIGLFDCREKGGITTSLYTKLAGTDFSFDIVALKTDKTINSNYVAAGGSPKYTRVELFDDTTPPDSCAAYANPVAVQTVAFSSSSTGLTSMGDFFNLPGVYKKLRCRVTECTNSTCTTISATAQQSCASDQFSVRPIAVTLMSSANAIAPSSTSTPLIKAGASFNLSASTTAFDNYSGLLTLDVSKLTAQNPINDTMWQNGGVVGTLTPTTITANTAVSNGTYSEVGYLYLAPGTYRDDSFTAVDSIKGDCIINSLSDTLTLASQQYGCSIGNTSTLSMGRFIPDHFGVVGAVVTRSELQLTELQKLPFTYMDEPMQLTLTVTAYNKNEGITLNYQGNFAKLNTTGWSLSNWTCIGLSCMGLSGSNGSTPLTDRLAIPTSSASNTIWSKGSSDFTANIILQRGGSPATPDGPYDALKLGVKPQDVDGVSLPPKAAADVMHCVNLNTLTGIENADCTFDTANETDLRRKFAETKVRFGRLSLANAYGSELQNLIIPVEAQYWNGSSFVRNDDDNYSTLVDNSMVVGNYQGRLLAKDVTRSPKFGAFDAAGNCNVTNDSTKNGVMSGGKSCILFFKPSISGSVNLLVNLDGAGGAAAICPIPSGSAKNLNADNMAYLRGNWCGENYDRDPTAQVTFGLYSDNGKGRNRLIYVREVY